MGVQVRVEPGGHALEIEPPESILDAATRSGWGWPTVCEGDAECGICFVDVLYGADGLPPPDDVEEFGLRNVPAWGARGAQHLRLACQLRPQEGLTVKKSGVQPR